MAGPAFNAQRTAEPMVKKPVCKKRFLPTQSPTRLRIAVARRGHHSQIQYELSPLVDGMPRPGGSTALALLALLNSGVKPDESVIQQGPNYLRELDRQPTYVVAHQTMVFAEVGDPKDLPLIQRNVD
jgi:hypothetical protein